VLVVIIDGYEHHVFLKEVDILSGSVVSMSGHFTVVEGDHFRGSSGWGEFLHEVCAKDVEFI
jgi:hypothetical protein